MPKHIDLTGKKFGKLTALEKIKINGLYHWKCRCDCGNEKTVVAGNLKRKIKPTKSCGCLNNEVPRKGIDNPNYKHGNALNGVRSRMLNIWSGMMRRCHDKNDANYPNYGARGIVVCERWQTFSNFLEDMKDAPVGLSLDRIDNNKGYSKENCRWATNTQQTRNCRSNVILEHNGAAKPLSVWAEDTGINYFTLYSRIKKLGWNVDKALYQQDRKKAQGR